MRYHCQLTVEKQTDTDTDNWIYTLAKMEKPNFFICLISATYGRV